jgi:hypothetical protein
VNFQQELCQLLRENSPNYPLIWKRKMPENINQNGTAKKRAMGVKRESGKRE